MVYAKDGVALQDKINEIILIEFYFHTLDLGPLFQVGQHLDSQMLGIVVIFAHLPQLINEFIIWQRVIVIR